MRGILVAGAIALASLSTPADAGMISYFVGKNQVEKLLKNDGFTDIVISKAWINMSPYQCKDSPIYTYKAHYHGRPVSGFACYRGVMWGAKYWED